MANDFSSGNKNLGITNFAANPEVISEAALTAGTGIAVKTAASLLAWLCHYAHVCSE
jgi:hypothetical protein